MPQASANGYTWNYTLSGTSPNQVASIGENTYSSATTLGAGISGGIIIPSTLDGYPVTSISALAFGNCGSLGYVTIPNSVTIIHERAFISCRSLSSINIPDSVTYIGGDVFYDTAPLAITMNTGKFGKTSPSSNQLFFGATGVTFYVPPSPTMTITATASGSPLASGSTTSNATIGLTFTSNEVTTNFIKEDISLTNGSLLSSFTVVSATVYTAIFTPTGQGLCTINVPANVFTSASGRINSASTPFTWTVDSVSPSMTITSTTPGVASGSTTNNTFISLTFTASESITGFQAGDISFNRGSLTNFAGSGAVYTATFTQAGLGAYTIYVPANVYSDSVGNSNIAASNTFNWTFDNILPSMTITATAGGLPLASGLTTNNAFIALTFTSTKTTTNFVVGDISLTNGVLSNFTGTGTVYTAIFTPTGRGACTINVLQGAYTDAAGNGNIAATQFNWTSTAWNIDIGANRLIKSYIKDFIDVSGSVVLRENSNLHVNGNTETAGNLSLNRLFVTADASFNRRIFVGGDVSMNGNVTVSGDMSMNGSVTKCNFNNSSIPKSAFSGTVPDGADYTTTKIVYDQTFQANDDVSMNGPTLAANNVKVSGNIVFGDGTVMNTADNNVLSTNPTVFNSSTFTALDICGNLVAGSYATSSDYRIKTNIVELDETYTVDKLRPVKYYQTQINREKYGLIAHELQEHYPDLVIGEKDGSELQRVNYTGLIAILINEIKRMKQNLAELETDVAVGR